MPPLDAVQKKTLETVVQRRLAGEPVSRIRGWREFWSMRFALSPATLDPRPDSETLVEAACRWVSARHTAPRCLDLGTGSGCLLLAVLSEIAAATGLGLDINADAVAVAERNARDLGLSGRASFATHDFTHSLGVHGQFALILANPPYIPRADIDGLAPDVRLFDPMLALDGGDDGLVLWRRMMPHVAAALTSDGAAFVEIGKGQEKAVAAIAAAAGLVCVDQFADLAGVVRCLHLAIKI